MGGSVIILAAEDDVADTLKPALVAAAADPERILVIRSVPSDDFPGGPSALKPICRVLKPR